MVVNPRQCGQGDGRWNADPSASGGAAGVGAGSEVAQRVSAVPSLLHSVSRQVGQPSSPSSWARSCLWSIHGSGAQTRLAWSLGEEPIFIRA